MFRTVVSRLGSSVQAAVHARCQPRIVSMVRPYSSNLPVMTPEQEDEAYIKYLSRSDVDGWDLRRFINKLQDEDLVPEPSVMIATLKACRRLNDYALAVRYLEAVHDKCAHRKKVIWPYLMQEIQPTLTELGISSLEEMGYDKPELAAVDVDDMHDK